MFRRNTIRSAFAGLVAATAGTLVFTALARGGAATIPSGFSDTALSTSLALPVGIAEIPDLPTALGRRVLFVEQKSTRVGLIAGGVTTTVGTVPGVVTADSERGLLGIAVDPAWPLRPYLYVHCTDGRVGNRIAISRFTATGDLAYTGNGQIQFAASSRYDLITDLPDAAGNHNGGTVRFGPDGLLYVSLGDDATGCPALDPNVPVGKILRLDTRRLPATAGGPAPYALLAAAGNPFATSADSSARLVWAYGLRNPFRFQIDPATGSLLVGDVGEGTWEELDWIDQAGMNLGWPMFEGPVSHGTCALTPPRGATGPIRSYGHAEGVAIVAGPRYRAVAVGTSRFPAEYDGDGFYLDYYGGFLRRVEWNGASWVAPPAAPGQPNATDWATGFDGVSDMLQLADGSLVYCRQSPGEIRRISYNSGVADAPIAGTLLALAAPRPSPARGPVTLAWTQPAPARVSLAVFDAAGRRVRALVADDERTAGSHEATWNGHDEAGRSVNPGLYFVRLEVGDEIRTARFSRIP